jgi:peptidoglycan/xylan/chitin deacetylase (PgdA/CDA1 family)
MRFVVAALALIVALMTPQPQEAKRQVCFTIDDLPWVSAVPRSIEDVEKQTKQLLSGLAAHRIPAIGFVNEGKLQRNGLAMPEQEHLLKLWLDAGLELGNHTLSHRDFHATPLDEFKQEVVRGEPVTTRLMGKRPRYFRHPMLHTGRSLDDKKGLEAFLAERGYRVAPVSIDNYDYIFARAYDRASGADRTRVLDTYIEYMTAVVAYYEQQSQVIVGREIRQILLMHANSLNAHAIDRLAGMFEQRGYTFVTLDRALEDPAYASADTYTGDAGITWLHRWAMTAGKRGIFAGEPIVPDWIERAGK